MTDVLALGPDGLVAGREGKTLELKRDLSSPMGPLRTIVAFANSAGGRLVVGVEDDGSVVGVADPLAEEERIANLISDHISPQLVPAIDLMTLGGQTVLVVDVPLSTRRPHYMTRQGAESGVYVRLGSTTRQADAALVAELERGARPSRTCPSRGRALMTSTWRCCPTFAAGRRRLRTSSRSAWPCDRALRWSPRTLAYSQPARTRRASCPRPGCSAGACAGPTVRISSTRRRFTAPCPWPWTRPWTSSSSTPTRPQSSARSRRRDVYSIPVEPIREVIVNALVHASYAERGTPIRIGFYDDRIQVDSPGLLLPGMTVETMRRVSRLRNPALARVFREAGIMEQWGTGVQRVFAQVAEAGLPEPVIEEVQDRVRVTIHVASHDPQHPSDDAARTTSDSGPTAPGWVGKGPSLPEHAYADSDDGRQDGRYDVVMMRAALNGPVHRDTLLAAAGLKPLSQNYTRHIVPLLQRGLLAMTVPDKPRSKAQRYRLTDAGRTYLDTLSGETTYPAGP